MRAVVVCLLAACAAPAQFRSTVPLVVSPATVRDAKGQYVDGLDGRDLILRDNNVTVPIQVDSQSYPISLVVAVETSAKAGPILDKLGGSGILFSQLVAADQGETALLTFSNKVEKIVDFSSDPDDLTHMLKKLRKEGDGAAALDAIELALKMLSHRPPGRRPVILMVSETRDRASESKLQDVVQDVQRQNVSIYWLTYSTFLAPFTDRKVKTYGDVRDDPEKEKENSLGLGRDKKKDAEIVPQGPDGMFDFFGTITELARLNKPNIANAFTRMTGAREINFLSKGALEQAIHEIGEEIHRQYVVTFRPPASTPGLFHKIRVEVKGRPDLQVKSREGYWAIQ